MDSIARHLVIRGRVQGVCFRASMAAEARRLEVRGWVRNRADSSVEAWLQGPAGAVQALIDWAHTGPPAARVDAVQVAVAELQTPSGFEQRPTL